MPFLKGSKNWSTAQIFPYALLALGLILLSYIRLQFLDIPFERDEGEYCYQAQLLLEGKLAYLDFYEQKPPGLFYTYALLQAIFGNSLQGVHLAFLFVNIFSILLLFAFCQKLFDAWAAAIASWSFGLLSLSKMAAGFSAQAEHLIVLFFVAALFFLQKALEQQKNGYWILSGFLLSWCVLIKQNGLFFFLIGSSFLLIEYYLHRSIPFQLLLKKLAFLVLGMLSPVLLFLLLFWQQGVIEEMLFWMIEYPKAYIGQYHWETGLRRFLKNFRRVSTTYQAFWSLGGLALLGIIFTKKTNLPKLWFWILAGLSFLAIVPGFRFYGHYFLLLSPGLAILVGLAFYLSKSYLKISLYPKLPLVLASLMLVANIIFNRSYYFQHDASQLLREVYHTNPFQETKLISDYLKENSKQGDQIAVWGSEPQINFYTNRKSPTRHNFFLFLMGSNERTAVWQKELIAETNTAKPRYIVKVNHPYSGKVTAKTMAIFYPWSLDYLEQHYQLIGLSEIYKDRASSLIWSKDLTTENFDSPYQVLVYQRKN